jgi:DNA repair protein RadC
MPPVDVMIRDLPRSERPRERLLATGPEALSEAELLAVLLRAGHQGTSVLAVATGLLAEHGGLAGLAGTDPRRLLRHGLVAAAVEIGRRLARVEICRRDLLNRPATVASYVHMRYGECGQEVMGALYLDVRNRLLREREIFRGTLHRAVADPREILKEGLLRDAAGLVLFHTHPSGDPAPSAEDLLFTKRIARAGELVGLRLIDHLIVGRGGEWTSLRERGGW